MCVYLHANTHTHTYGSSLHIYLYISVKPTVISESHILWFWREGVIGTRDLVIRLVWMARELQGLNSYLLRTENISLTWQTYVHAGHHSVSDSLTRVWQAAYQVFFENFTHVYKSVHKIIYTHYFFQLLSCEFQCVSLTTLCFILNNNNKNVKIHSVHLVLSIYSQLVGPSTGEWAPTIGYTPKENRFFSPWHPTVPHQE